MGAWVRPLGLVLCGCLLAGLGACASSPSTYSGAGGSSAYRTYGASPRVVSAGTRMQCVPYARAESGIQIYGDAHLWWSKAAGSYTRASRPVPGAVLVIEGYKTSKRGHVAVVRRVVDNRTVIVDHANWLNQGQIHLSAPVKDVSARNDWSEVRVWYTPGGTLGTRVYSARGFIYPKGQRVASR